MAASKSEVAQIARLMERIEALEMAIRELRAALAMPAHQRSTSNGKIASHVGR